MGSAKTPEKAREYFLNWKANRPEQYVKSYQKRNTRTYSWSHISKVFMNILINE